jgi:hypothetical protein
MRPQHPPNGNGPSGEAEAAALQLVEPGFRTVSDRPQQKSVTAPPLRKMGQPDPRASVGLGKTSIRAGLAAPGEPWRYLGVGKINNPVVVVDLAPLVPEAGGSSAATAPPPAHASAAAAARRDGPFGGNFCCLPQAAGGNWGDGINH